MEDLRAIKERVWIGGGANISHQFIKLLTCWLSGCQGNRAWLQHFVGMPH